MCVHIGSVGELLAGIKRPNLANGFAVIRPTRPLEAHHGDADDGMYGYELWKSDGTAAGTVMVKDIRPGLRDSSPDVLIDVGGILYFTARDGTYGRELWQSNGTDAGTVMVKDIGPGSRSSKPLDLVYVPG